MLQRMVNTIGDLTPEWNPESLLERADCERMSFIGYYLRAVERARGRQFLRASWCEFVLEGFD